MNNELKRQIIMAHFNKTAYKVKEVTNSDLHISTDEIATCDDRFNIYINLDGLKIKEVLFTGRGCTISTSALDILIASLVDKDIKEVKEFINNYVQFIKTGIPNGITGELLAFDKVHDQVNRIECATIGAKAILKAVENV